MIVICERTRPLAHLHMRTDAYTVHHTVSLWKIIPQSASSRRTMRESSDASQSADDDGEAKKAGSQGSNLEGVEVKKSDEDDETRKRVKKTEEGAEKEKKELTAAEIKKAFDEAEDEEDVEVRGCRKWFLTSLSLCSATC